jgi:hypothetical protein
LTYIFIIDVSIHLFDFWSSIEKKRCQLQNQSRPRQKLLRTQLQKLISLRSIAVLTWTVWMINHCWTDKSFLLKSDFKKSLICCSRVLFPIMWGMNQVSVRWFVKLLVKCETRFPMQHQSWLRQALLTLHTQLLKLHYDLWLY